MANEPLILTLALDEASFARFDDLRRRHFPPGRNRVPAHLTLFHHLPGERQASVARDIEQLSTREPPLVLSTSGLRFLGRGVAFDVDAPRLVALRGLMAERWSAWLSLQDRQGFRPHITVQNKVDPRHARALLEELSATFQPFSFRGEGLHLWHYRGGPWDLAATFPFQLG